MELSKASFLHSAPVKVIIFLAVSLILFGWLLDTPGSLLGKADAIGFAVCHRIDARSFHLGGRPLPLCARCSGMYLGALLGLVYQSLVSWRKGGMPPKRVIIPLAFFVLAFGLDGLNSYLHLFPGAPSLYEPQNWLRLATGSGMGLVMSVALYPVFNQTVWRDWDKRPALPGLRSLGILVALAALLYGLVLSENPLILYPLALLSAGTVLLLLTLVYTMICLIVLRYENRFMMIKQLLFPLVSGFGIALVQIVALDLIRFWLTGTWDGFHLG
jgi:uncharacterized membrane protein